MSSGPVTDRSYSIMVKALMSAAFSLLFFWSVGGGYKHRVKGFCNQGYGGAWLKTMTQRCLLGKAVDL